MFAFFVALSASNRKPNYRHSINSTAQCGLMKLSRANTCLPCSGARIGQRGKRSRFAGCEKIREACAVEHEESTDSYTYSYISFGDISPLFRCRFHPRKWHFVWPVFSFHSGYPSFATRPMAPARARVLSAKRPRRRVAATSKLRHAIKPRFVVSQEVNV